MLQQKSRQRSRNMMSTNFSTKLQIYCNSRELIIHTQPLNFDDTEMEVYGLNYTCSIHSVLMLDSWTFNDISPSLSFPLLPPPKFSQLCLLVDIVLLQHFPLRNVHLSVCPHPSPHSSRNSESSVIILLL